MSVCKRCGSAVGYSRKLSVTGSVVYWGEWGNEATTVDEDVESDDALRYREPKFLRCLTCNGATPNPRYGQVSHTPVSPEAGATEPPRPALDPASAPPSASEP